MQKDFLSSRIWPIRYGNRGVPRGWWILELGRSDVSNSGSEIWQKKGFFAGVEDNDFVSFIFQICAHVVKERGEGFTAVGLLSSGVATPERVVVRIGQFLREINCFVNEPKFYVCRTCDFEFL